MTRPIHRQAGLSVLLLALLALPSLPVSAQPQPSDDARRFLVYPPNKIISFQDSDGYLYLHYDGLQQDKGRDGKGNPLLYNQVVQVTRYQDEQQAVAACKAMLGVPLKGKTIRIIEGFPCAFVQETTDGNGARITYYRSSWYAQGRYFVSLGETAEPRSMLPAAPPVEPLLAVLNSVQRSAPKSDPQASPQISVAPPPSGTATDSVRIDGNTIYVTSEGGNTRVLTLVPAKKADMPVFSPPTVSGEAKAFEHNLMARLYEASYAHLAPDLRQTFVIGMPMPSDVASDAARATLEAGESAVNWAKDNPADVAVLGLSIAVSVAFPISAFASPTVAVGGAAVVRGVVGGAMVAGTTGFVSSLSGSFLSDKSAMQRVKEAAAKGVGDAGASIPGSLTGAAFETAVGQGLAKSAVTAGSIAVGVAVDKAMEKAQVSQSIADAALKAPSFAASLVAPSSPTYEPGGISLNFDR